jgi:pre-mRNA-splicing helicase BRR2
LNDYDIEPERDEDEMEQEEVQVPGIAFSDESEEYDSDFDKVLDLDQSGDEGVDKKGALATRGGEDEDEDANGEGALNPEQIDAFWLQTELGKHFDDHSKVFKFEKLILNVLLNPDLRFIENHLVGWLDFERFELVKLLIENRYTIFYCTKLK